MKQNLGERTEIRLAGEGGQGTWVVLFRYHLLLALFPRN